jgi:hypothetical protein
MTVSSLTYWFAGRLSGLDWAKAWYASHGVKYQVLDDMIRGKTVALVGNARALAGTACGEAIDAHDIVIRMNAAPGLGEDSHGRRTDLLAASVPVERDALASKGAKLILWMTQRRNKLPLWMLQSGRLWFYPAADHAALVSRVSARPSTGIMVLDVMSRSPAASVTLFGFDFFQSLSLSGDHSASSVPHNFAGEEGFAMDLIARDSRFRIERPGK